MYYPLNTHTVVASTIRLEPFWGWVSGPVFKWNQGALLGGLGCVWCRAWRVQWDQQELLILKGKPARQLVDNANLSWNWSALRTVFVLKAGPSWVKLNIHEWKRLRGFTARVLSTKQTNKPNMVKTCLLKRFQVFNHSSSILQEIVSSFDFLCLSLNVYLSKIVKLCLSLNV